jgi:Fe-Mn family superoxide dismutase
MAKFSLPILEYAYNELEPSIDAETMQIHHTKHHQAYVDNLNKLSSHVPTDLHLEQMISGIFSITEGYSDEDKQILIKFGGGHYNHSLFWNYMCKDSNEKSISHFLFERLEVDFGSLDLFKEAFDKESIKVFGSGWAWWVYDYEKRKSYITSTKDQINPVMENPHLVCLLGLDVWEHAYYLKYQNKRAQYVNNFWNVVNWKRVSIIHDKIVLNNKKLEITNDGYIIFE